MMERLFECVPSGFLEVPDGTLVNPFLNPKDVMSGLPWDLLDGLSVAAGYLKAGVVSEIHVHPFVSLVTVIVSGQVDLVMKDSGTQDPPRSVRLACSEPDGGDAEGFSTAAALARPGTFFQLDNSKGQVPANVLYLTSPCYIFEPGPDVAGPPIYDDAVTLGRDWDVLAESSWNPPQLAEPSRSFAARQRAIERLAARSRST